MVSTTRQKRYETPTAQRSELGKASIDSANVRDTRGNIASQKARSSAADT